MDQHNPDAAFAWQVGIWDAIASDYEREVDARFSPVVDRVLKHADLQPGQSVLDLGTGTGSVALSAASQVGSAGRIVAVDISPEMLAKARARAESSSLTNVEFREGRAEEIPASDGSHDAVLASLSMMYVIDRAAAAREIARVLRPGGRFVAAVWAGPSSCDIVQFQQLAGSFAPAPPVDGVGPGALANPAPFLDQLSIAGLNPCVETETTTFHFSDFNSAWKVLAGVTTAILDPGIVNEARSAVQAQMWRDANEPREFNNDTQFIVARKPE